MYKIAEDPPAKPKNAPTGKDSGDWGYAGLGAGLGGIAAWLIGRMIHGEKFKKSKAVQLLYLLGGMAAGGGGGFAYGKELINSLSSPTNKEPMTTDPKTHKPVPYNDIADKKTSKDLLIRHGEYAAGGAVLGGGAGYGAGALFDKIVPDNYKGIPVKLDPSDPYMPPISYTRGYKDYANYTEIGKPIFDPNGNYTGKNTTDAIVDSIEKSMNNRRKARSRAWRTRGAVGGVVTGAITGLATSLVMDNAYKQLIPEWGRGKK